MSMWRSPARWRPSQFGWLMPAELPPFAAWLLPGAVGVLAMLATRASGGSFPSQPEHLDQLSLLGPYWVTTLLYAPLWGLPAMLAALLLRGVLLSQGWFGWASALLAGAAAGIAVPLLLGMNLWLDGPLYGAAFLWLQHVMYRLLHGSEID